MNNVIEDFLNKKEAEYQDKKEQEKQRLLLELKLVEKEYSPFYEYNDEYPYSEFDEQGYILHWYKEKPIQISDEEYEELKKYAKSNPETTSNKNSLATTLTVIAWLVFICGFILGIAAGEGQFLPTNTNAIASYFAYEYPSTSFSFSLAFNYWLNSFIYGIIFLVFAEIIKLLNAIKNK